MPYAILIYVFSSLDSVHHPCGLIIMVAKPAFSRDVSYWAQQSIHNSRCLRGMAIVREKFDKLPETATVKLTKTLVAML